MGRTFVIVGAGLAGATAAGALRDQGFAGRIVLIGAEHELPYDRPPLSKDYLLDRSEKAKIYVHPRQWYADRDIELRLGTRVAAIDRVAHAVELEGGERIGYDKLLLTTGASPRRLNVPGARAGWCAVPAERQRLRGVEGSIRRGSPGGDCRRGVDRLGERRRRACRRM